MGTRSILEKAGLKIIDTKDAMAGREELAQSAVEKSIVKPSIFIRKGDKIEAVRAALVPPAYMDCEFSIDKIMDNQREQLKKSGRKFIVRNFNAYRDVTLGIISTILSNKVPNQSYVIGAPNGFGKTSFVNTCIMRLFSQGKRCTPYISLTDLASVRLDNEKRILEGINSRLFYKSEDIIDSTLEEYSDALYDNFDSNMYVKKPIHIIDRYSWDEYMNCDLLFCYFTDVSAKVVESEIFKTAITIRGAKGLPTIAMISTSLVPYRKDATLAQYVWDEILSYDDSPSYDRVRHVSCYKDYNTPLEIKLNNGG